MALGEWIFDNAAFLQARPPSSIGQLWNGHRSAAENVAPASVPSM
jgi:hypothetical protein